MPVVGARLHNGAHATLVILERMSSPRLPSTLLALASCHADELKGPPETKLGPSMRSTLKGLVGEAGGAAG